MIYFHTSLVHIHTGLNLSNIILQLYAVTMLSHVMIKFYTKFHVPGNNDSYVIITTNWQPCTDLIPQIQTAIVLTLLMVRNKLYGDNIIFNGIMFKPRNSKINLFALYRLMGDTRAHLALQQKKGGGRGGNKLKIKTQRQCLSCLGSAIRRVPSLRQTMLSRAPGMNCASQPTQDTRKQQLM